MQRPAYSGLLFDRHEKQHEPAASRPQKLAPERASGDSRLVEPVNLWCADGCVEPTLLHPGIVEQSTKGGQATVTRQGAVCLVDQQQHVFKIVLNTRQIGQFGSLDVLRATRNSGKKEQQALIESRMRSSLRGTRSTVNSACPRN